jgi:hypothetical protein
MFLREEGLFLLHHSLQASCLKAIVNSLGGERLVGDIGKDFGDIDSGISLSRADKTLGMTNVGRRELSRTTATRLGEVRTM